MLFCIGMTSKGSHGSRGEAFKPPFFHVVLIEPEIPQNTGNIGRTCVGFQSRLHLVGPLGFEISDAKLRRAGLDYWVHLDWIYYPTREDWIETFHENQRVFLFSAQASQDFFEIPIEIGDTFVFGKETAGLPKELLSSNRCLKIPFPGPIRGFNLASAVAIVLAEAYRQTSRKINQHRIFSM